jgi:tRNA (guanine37-N1)-methyltransferase
MSTMTFDIVTIFPAMIERALEAGIVGRAIARGTLGVTVHDLRSFTSDRHRVVDDVPYGGGPGMVLKPEPLFRALNRIEQTRGAAWVVLMSPQGRRLTQDVVRALASRPHVALLCGRYEGVDERIRASVDEEVSIGDYVLSGGELPALVVVDAVARLIPGVVGDQQSVVEESFGRGLLDFPHYTRPADVADETLRRGTGGTPEHRVPDVLLSGNHAVIRRWRKRQAVARTLDRRPDLLADAALDDEELEILRELVAERDKGDRDGLD